MAGWLSGLCQNLPCCPLLSPHSECLELKPTYSCSTVKLGFYWHKTELNLVEHRRRWENPDTKRTHFCRVFHAFISTQRFFSAVQMQKNSMLLSYVCQNGDRNETVLLCYINIWMLGLIKLAYQYAFLFRHNAIKGSNRNGLTCQN